MPPLRVQIAPQRRRGASRGEPLGAAGASREAGEPRAGSAQLALPGREILARGSDLAHQRLARRRQERVGSGARPRELQAALGQELGLVVAIERQPGAAEGGVELAGDPRLVAELVLDPCCAIGEEGRRRGIAAGTEVGIEAAENRRQKIAHSRRAFGLESGGVRLPERSCPLRRRATA